MKREKVDRVVINLLIVSISRLSLQLDESGFGSYVKWCILIANFANINWCDISSICNWAIALPLSFDSQAVACKSTSQ